MRNKHLATQQETASHVLDYMNRFGEDDVMFKPKSAYTMEDLTAHMKARISEPDRMKRDQMMRAEQKLFEKVYGTDPVSYDETGKMIQPKPKEVFSKAQSFLRSPQGDTLEQSVEKLLNSLPQSQDAESNISRLKRAVRGFQAGSNLLTSEKAKGAEPALKEDGQFGPKTARKLKRNLLEFGAGPTSETIAIGQMKELLRGVRQKGASAVPTDMRRIFSPLLPHAHQGNARGYQPEGLALQDTLNDLKPDHAERLKDDGIIGPKTQAAFEQVSNYTPDEAFVKRFAHNLGFIDAEG